MLDTRPESLLNETRKKLGAIKHLSKPLEAVDNYWLMD